ncbi:MAG: excisionase family DNA-binding protein [Propionibacteriaceae bacterium]|jgi:excisionase family DNA binding protein|nr:excisionase family DNA-binding protein [Propionibacteriaceae bacterium]
MSVINITSESPDQWDTVIREHLAAGEHVRVTFERPSITPAQMAESIGVSRATITRRILAGEIRTEKRGNRHRIPLPEVERFRHTYVHAMAADLAVNF